MPIAAGLVWIPPARRTAIAECRWGGVAAVSLTGRRVSFRTRSAGAGKRYGVVPRRSRWFGCRSAESSHPSDTSRAWVSRVVVLACAPRSSRDPPKMEIAVVRGSVRNEVVRGA